MSAVGKAIWFIETHFADELSLDDIAGSGFERFDDAFDFQTGQGGLEIWIPLKA